MTTGSIEYLWLCIPCGKYRGQMVEALGKMIARGAVRVDYIVTVQENNLLGIRHGDP